MQNKNIREERSTNNVLSSQLYSFRLNIAILGCQRALFSIFFRNRDTGTELSQHSPLNSYTVQLWSHKYGCARICSGDLCTEGSAVKLSSVSGFSRAILNITYADCCSPHTHSSNEQPPDPAAALPCWQSSSGLSRGTR